MEPTEVTEPASGDSAEKALMEPTEALETDVPSESAIPDRELFRIGAVSRLTATKQFVLRYWESEFPTLQPVKSPKGHRLYRREDIDTVLKIKRLLYDEGFTIAGARRHLRDQVYEPNAAPQPDAASVTAESSRTSVRDHHNDENQEMFAVEEEGRSAVVRPALPAPQASPLLNRKTLLDLRDALRSFLTLLERE